MDEIGAYPVDGNAFREAVEFVWLTPDCAAVFENRLGPYYDLWALRESRLPQTSGTKFSIGRSATRHRMRRRSPKPLRSEC